MSNIKTAIVIGETGAGKSYNSNAIIQKNNAFVTGSTPDSVTFETSAQYNYINGKKIYMIDTQGMKSSDSCDSRYIRQMVDFLKNWSYGINAFYIVMNSQNPRFDLSLQTMLKIINDFFNNPNFWKNAGIIFTRCYRSGKKTYYNENELMNEYRQKVIDHIHQFDGCRNINITMPCFFVDADQWETNEDIKLEYNKIRNFMCNNNSVSTQNVKVTRPEYKEKKEEIINNVFTYSEYQGYGNNRMKIFHYEDQRRYRITNWQNQVYYTNPETIRRWTETKYSKVEYEEETRETSTDRIPVYRTVHKSAGFWRTMATIASLGIAGSGNKTYDELDHYDYITHYERCRRKKVIDPDGNVSYGSWYLISTWEKRH